MENKNSTIVGKIKKFSCSKKDCDFRKPFIAYCYGENERYYNTVSIVGNINFAEKRFYDVVSTVRGYSDIKPILKQIAKLQIEKEKIEKRTREIRAEMYEGKDKLSEITGILCPADFEKQIEAVLSTLNTFTKKSGYYQTYPHISECSSKGDVLTMTIEHTSDISKWTNPEDCPFIYREYDGCCFIDETIAPKEYKRCLNKNLPCLVSKLAKYHTDKNDYLSLGDKNWLSANRVYHFKLHHGFSKKSVEEFKDILKG